MAKLSEQMKSAGKKIASLPDEAAGGVVEEVTHHKAAAAGAVAGFAVAGPVGAAAGGALGEASAKFVSRLAEGWKAFQESPEIPPEVAVARIKDPSFFGKAMEVLPAGLVEAATGKRPIGKKEREAQTAAQYEVRFAQVIHHITKLPPEEQNEIRVQILEKGKIGGPEAAAAHYTLLKLDAEYQKNVVTQEEEKQKQLTAEAHTARKATAEYQKNQPPELQAERTKYEARVQAYETFLAKIQNAKNPAEVRQAVDEAKSRLTGAVEQKQTDELKRERASLDALEHLLIRHDINDAANRTQAENELQGFEAHLAKKDRELKQRIIAYKNENANLIAQLQTGKETIDTAKVEAEMPAEWKEAKRKQDEAKAALAQLTHPTAPNQARTARILVRNEGANNQAINDYQAEYNRVAPTLRGQVSRGRIEAEIDRTKGREFRESAEKARKENTAIQGVRAGFARGSNTEALTYLKSLTSTQQKEMDKHKKKQDELSRKYTTRKPLTDDEVAKEIGGDYQELWQRNKGLNEALDYVKNRQANIGPAGDYRRIAAQIRNFALIEQKPLMAEMGELAIKQGTKTAAPDRELIKYFDGLEAHLAGSYQGRFQVQKGIRLARAVDEQALRENSPMQKYLQEARERLNDLKGDPEKKLEAAKKEKAESATKIKAAQERQASLEPALQASEKYIAGVYGKDFLTRVDGRMEQIATVREDLTQLDAAAAKLTGESQEQKETRAHDLIKKRQKTLSDLEHASDTSLRGFVRDLRAAGIAIDEDDEEEAISQMRKVGSQYASRSLFGIFASLLNSLISLQTA